MTEADIYIGFFNQIILGLVLPVFITLLLFRAGSLIFKKGIRGY